MRSMAVVAATAIGLGLICIPPDAVAAGFGHRHHASGYGARIHGGLTPPAYRYFLCRGGRVYTLLGGWGCDYYWRRYNLPRRH